VETETEQRERGDSGEREQGARERERESERRGREEAGSGRLNLWQYYGYVKKNEGMSLGFFFNLFKLAGGWIEAVRVPAHFQNTKPVD
jgi:hypothetical protein